ncbi:MAG: hypothetical protein OSJ23_10480 [Mucispirillum schaedleri]|nr:hypothetical protein [Mucispirillum schaedleri]
MEKEKKSNKFLDMLKKAAEWIKKGITFLENFGGIIKNIFNIFKTFSGSYSTT